MPIVVRNPDIFSGRPRPRRSATGGFTLIETALAIVIVGTGVVSIMYAQQAFHLQNMWSTHTSTATLLANEIREMTVRLPRHDPVTGATTWGPEENETGLIDFDDLDDFDGSDSAGTTYSAADGTGPISAMRQIILNMPGWSQTVYVFNIDPQDISAEAGAVADGGSDMMRVEVVVSYQGPNDPEPVPVTSSAWISSR